MGFSHHRQMFDPLDLEIIDRVYEAATAHLAARDLYREPLESGATEALRKAIFACAAGGRLDFDTLCDQVLARLAETANERRAA